MSLNSSSDDGSQLYIDGSLVVDNDGIHPTRSRQGRIRLGTGIHTVEIHYFQGPRDMLLRYSGFINPQMAPDKLCHPM